MRKSTKFHRRCGSAPSVTQVNKPPRFPGRIIIAIRDNSHLFHLFVAKEFQGRRLASQLWHIAKSNALIAGNPGSFTVNSSLNALAVYESFGFVREGEVQRMHGISFQPMRLSIRNAASRYYRDFARSQEFD